jgi:hypothetical protein
MTWAHRARGARTNSARLNRGHVTVCGTLLVVAISVLLGGGSAVAATTPQVPAPSYLFSIPTASGSLTGPNDRHLTLRLTGTRNYLTRFTDRPLRQAFVVANVDFARRFKAYFAGSRPNAVLTFARPGAQIPVSVVLTLGQPRWNARRHTWTFPATRIRKQPDNLPGTSIQINPPLIPNPHAFKSATLLIDGGSTGADGPIELAGGGIANSISGFLQRQRIPSAGLLMRVGVEYSYALTDPGGRIDSTALLPVEFTTAPLNLAVQPNSPLCAIETGVVHWQNAYQPSQEDGAYIFDLTLSRADQAPTTYTLQYPSAPNGLVSAACSG